MKQNSSRNFYAWSLSAVEVAIAILAWCSAMPAYCGSSQSLAVAAREESRAWPANGVPILVYHRFGPVVADEMTVTTTVFDSQLKFLRAYDYTVISLKTLLDYMNGTGGPLPARPVVITADDGHISVFTEMYPRMKREHYPATLFIYPSAISNASYAMTWQQLATLKESGVFSIQSHTYWHPNFHTEKKRLAPADYQRFVADQLTKSKQTLERRLGISVNLLAWPFGIYDDELIAAARQAGYTAAFSIERRNVFSEEKSMALPRYIVTNHDAGAAFARLLSGQAADRSRKPAADHHAD